MAALTDAEKVDVRRHAGYPMFGDVAEQAFGWRFATQYGTLEYRMIHLQDAEATVIRSYITQLNQLEADEAGVRENLDTAQAAVWTRNPDEHADRQKLYASWQKKLLAFFGVPPGPGIGNSRMISKVV